MEKVKEYRAAASRTAGSSLIQAATQVVQKEPAAAKAEKKGSDDALELSDLHEEPAVTANTNQSDYKAERAINRAQKKFDQMDLDGSGALEENELLRLADWVWNSFNPGGCALSDEERVCEKDKLLQRLDNNADQKMDFDEFSDW